MTTSYMNATRGAGTNPATYYRSATYISPQTAAQRVGPNVTDDYERWYTESVPNNRMTLSLRSGIDQEISWALDRLCRLCHNEQFLLRSIPGLIDALFEWPEWYIREGHKAYSEVQSLFSVPRELQRRRRHALESLFVLRNAAMHESNSQELSVHSHTAPLILNALHDLDPHLDQNAEFILHTIDLLQSVASKLILPPPSSPPSHSPLLPLQRIASTSSNRSAIIAALTTITTLLSTPQNNVHIVHDSPSLAASIRYLPLFVDKPLVDACLNYLYVHLSASSAAKAFLLHPEMTSVLRVLVSFLISEQIEETVTLEVPISVRTIPSATRTTVRDHELTAEELDALVEIPEPQRCYDWMKTMFIPKADGELTQVDFWNLYKDTFSPFQDKQGLLVASDVIKNVTHVFTNALAMVLTDPIQRFIVRGVDRRKDSVSSDRFKCLWDRTQCPAPASNSSSELYEHVLEHFVAIETAEFPCLWSSCQHAPLSKPALRAHILTHLSHNRFPEKPPSQSDTITLTPEHSHYPIEDPTRRPPPPPRSMTISYQTPIVDPPSSALTALLCIRILFKTSFASADAAPRIDADHFGFPGIVEDSEELDGDELSAGDAVDSEREGQRRGRKAFIGVRALMEGVRIRDEVLMSWITEMVDAGLTGTH